MKELLDFRESDLSKDSLGQVRFLRAELKAMIFVFMNRKNIKWPYKLNKFEFYRVIRQVDR